MISKLNIDINPQILEKLKYLDDNNIRMVNSLEELEGVKMLKRKVDIVYEEYDEDYYFVKILKENKNICIEFILCEFVEEMNHWDIFTKCWNRRATVTVGTTHCFYEP